jgi:hypothetical protein
LSIFDLISDLYMIYFYFSNDQSEYAIGTLSMIVMSLVMQCFVIFAMYRQDVKAMKREMFYTLTLVKGGRTQLNLLKGVDTQGCNLEIAYELIIFQGCEIMFESIPGSVLQAHAIVVNKDYEWVQIISLFLSALFVATISSMMSIYQDISSRNREKA